MSGSPAVRRRRPRGWLRQVGGLLAPNNLEASRWVASRAPARRARRAAASVGESVARRRGQRERMRALRLAPGGRLRWASVPAPLPPRPDGAVVHPLAIATCDMDCLLFMGRGPFVMPLHLGHECVAEVVSVGERVDRIRVGDRVVVPFQISCGRCATCRQGWTANCLSVPSGSTYGFGFATGHWGGAYADLLAVPFADAMCVPLPEGVDPAAAASVADNVCDGFRHAVPHVPDLVARDPDARVIVIAAVSRRSFYSSSIALYAGLAARAHGAREVWLADSRPHMRAHAARLGLHAVRPEELRRAPLAPLVVDVSVSAKGLALALSCTAPDGICTSTGNLHRRTKVPSLQMYLDGTTLTGGRPNVRMIMPAVLEAMQSGRFRPELVTTAVAALDDAPRVLPEHYVGGGVKTVLVAQ